MKKQSSVRNPSIKLGLSWAFVYLFLITDNYLVGLGSLVLTLILGMSLAVDASRLFDRKPTGVHVQLISAGVGMTLLAVYFLLESFLVPVL